MIRSSLVNHLCCPHQFINLRFRLSIWLNSFGTQLRQTIKQKVNLFRWKGGSCWVVRFGAVSIPVFFPHTQKRRDVKCCFFFFFWFFGEKKDNFFVFCFFSFFFLFCCFFSAKHRTSFDLAKFESVTLLGKYFHTCEDISVSKQKQIFFHPMTNSTKLRPFPFSLMIGWYLSFFRFLILLREKLSWSRKILTLLLSKEMKTISINRIFVSVCKTQ